MPFEYFFRFYSLIIFFQTFFVEKQIYSKAVEKKKQVQELIKKKKTVSSGSKSTNQTKPKK